MDEFSVNDISNVSATEDRVENEDKPSVASENEIQEDPKTEDLPIELTETSETNLHLFDFESNEDGEKEEVEKYEEPYPYGKDYEPITSKNIKAIDNELCRIRLCWPPIDTLHHQKISHYAQSYMENNNKEKLLLLYAENFRKQYQTSFPTKTPLFLAAENECHVQKMVCTTIRPTKLHYPEFYTWQGCGKFISDHIVYIPLENPTSLPTQLVSGETVLLRQQGHCFEMSTLLVSYLLAVGYDAYVVAGYATREYCSNDQSYTACPYLPNSIQEVREEQDPLDAVKEPRYVAKEPRDLRSKFLLMMEQREIDKREKKLQEELELERQRIEELERPPPDHHFGWRTHSWVLILPGKRDVEEPLFLEPATGVGSCISNPQYLGIESVWNHSNYWVNIQSCANGCAALSFDLKNTSLWEHLLVGEPWDWRKTKVGSDCEEKDLVLQEKHLDMPTSWVEPLLIRYSRFERRYPKGQKQIQYKKAKMNLFAPYIQKDGLVSQIIVYNDYEYEHPEILYEKFNYREDYLTSLTTTFAQNTTEKNYLPGREDALKKQITCVSTNTKTMEFYHSVRHDGLQKVVIDDISMVEEFVDREDRLYNISITFEPKNLIPNPNNPNDSRWSISEGQHRKVEKIVEKFHRNPDIAADEDTAIRVFDLSLNEISITYHYGDRKVTASTRYFKKPSISDIGDTLTFNPELTSGFMVHPRSPDPKKVELFWLLDENLKAEERALEHVRDMENEIMKIFKNLFAEFVSPGLFISIFDEQRNKKAELGMKERERKMREKSVREVEAEIDFLAVYRTQLENEALTKQSVQIIKQKCLNDYKQLLVDRANRIQQKFDRSMEMLQQKHDWYEHLGVNISHEAEEAYVEEVSRLGFYLHTLEIRLMRHKDLAGPRYSALETWLQNDYRLRPSLNF